MNERLLTLPQEATLHLILRLGVATVPIKCLQSRREQQEKAKQEAKEQQVMKELAIAPGGFIEQTIAPDTLTPEKLGPRK